ncbi:MULTISPECIES: tripartite tricarboxylate transporter substrate binding protein [unclassified Polynucleobacter]|jgi:tripartite-type tricarboxylate transporter receptor subunit TctC|uniref:Bug family tripartite tricarboxylate transporter substrate binding protein n=1 Tax=unclassified Polynucleobacter TaxID=2640945 RepID=UPI001BFE67BA|nr:MULTISPECIES: tripartite tricarboxylate transporter substrate binding protein [unclassified Polynucleobacter]QWE22015.1 tripartite tricarboxylate transporter substrate binding protein [Polynucleobacter sp. AP-Jannik-300A-C4]QWE28128.1 tripartite tricarboxylate transporter substrate binding protein [Polynucleobacter sp. AM-7D1]
MFKIEKYKFSRRLVLLAGALTLALPQLATAQSWPTKPIKLIIPFNAGGTTDILGRLLAQQLTKDLGQNVVVENKGGAGGNIAAEFVAQSPADGYTIMLASGSMLTVNPNLYKRLPVNYSKDFVNITNVASGPMMLSVSNKIPVKNLNEFITYAKTKDLNFGSAGIGSQVHMAGENLTYAANIPATHVPYKGESAAINDLVAGQIDFMVGNLTAATGFAKNGQIKPIAVTSSKRVKQLPDVPTVAESGIPGFESTGWFGLVAPASTPKAITDKIYAATVKAVNSEAMKKSLDMNGLTPIVNTQDEFNAQIKAESANWEKVIKGRNISTQ